MNLKEYFDSININEIERFIQDIQEENVHLEFKTTMHPIYNNENREFDKKNISKVISGFANSNGGIVIWGIKAKENEKKQDVAYKKKPIKELTKFLNILNRLEGQALTPIVSGVIHEPIEIGSDEGFIKTYVPPSDFAPHMANYSNKHYYKRSGDSFYICEHYDIIDLINRKRSPKLKFELTPFNLKPNDISTNYDLETMFVIANESGVLAKYPMLQIKINSPFSIYEYGIDGNKGTGLHRKNFKHRSATYSGGNDIVIYSESKLGIDKIYLPNFIDETDIQQLTIQYRLVCENMKVLDDTYIIEKNELIEIFKTQKK